jgi:hypothetical protein
VVGYNQSQSGSLYALVSLFIQAGKLVEELCLIFGFYTYPRIAYLEAQGYFPAGQHFFYLYG